MASYPEQRGTNMIVEKTFDITFDDLNYFEYHLRNGIEFENTKDADTVACYSMQLTDDLWLDLKVVNAPTEGGGAYVDPVIFEAVKKPNGRVDYNEYAVMDVLDTLTELEFELDNVTYRVSPTIKETLDK